MINRDLDHHTAYRRRRYYAHLTDDQLCERYAGLLDNALVFDRDGPPVIVRTATRRSRALVWTQEELRLRCLGQRACALEEHELSRPRPRMLAACRLLAGITPLRRGSQIVKFGRRTHIQAMIEQGRFRISPATTYDDPSLNRAIRDDERRAELFMPNGTTMHVKIDDTYHEVPRLTAPLRYNVRCENFYVFCAATVLDARCFDDFDADAIMIVRDLQTFSSRLIPAFGEAAGVTKYRCGSVLYLDPLHAGYEIKEVEITKHVRYSYQHEWRILWAADDPIPDDAMPLTIDIGTLADCCEAHYL